MITIECSTEELELLLHAATSDGSCLMILKTNDGTPVYLRVRAKERRTRNHKAGVASAGRPPAVPHSGDPAAA